MKKKKKAFTLVELLAVIVILAVILVIAVPQISKVIKQTKINSLASTAKLIAAKAEEKEVENDVLGIDETMTCASLVKLDDDYDSNTCTVTKTNGDWTVNISGSSTGKFSGITCTGTKSNMTCTTSDLAPGEYLGAHPCTFEGELVDGATYVNGQYKYTYIASTYNTWEFYMGEDSSDVFPNLGTPTVTTTGGWHVQINRPTVPWSADITSTICSSVDRKPIISMAGMYNTAVDVELDLSTIDTSNVIDMAGMFGSYEGTIDVSNFDTTNVIRTLEMFASWGYQHQVDIIGLDHFNTSNVINMNGMFWGVKTNTLDLSSFDTSSVLDFSQMFKEANIHTIYASNAFVTTNLRFDDEMFNWFPSGVDNLVGGNGTDCTVSNIDSEYARIDAPGTPGCFTAKP